MSNRKEKVCIVAPFHPWDDVRVFQKEAVTLAEAGYEVVLLAQAPRPMIVRGVKVVPAWAPRSPRLIRFLSAPLNLVQALAQKAKFYHLHNPDTLPLGLGLKALGKRIVYDTHEDYSQRLLGRNWIPALLKKPLGRLVCLLEALMGRVAERVIVTQTEVAARIGGNTVLLGNPPRTDSALLEAVSAGAGRIEDDFQGVRAIYLGEVNANRGLFDMVDALESANRIHPVRLWLIGLADPRDLEAASRRPGWRYVDYQGRLPQEEAFAYVARARVGLIPLRDIGDFRNADPNKIYEYMAIGIPFISSDFPAWRCRLGGCDAGWFIPPAEPGSLAQALLEAMDETICRQKSEAGRQYVKSYNWERESEKLTALYSAITSAGSPSKSGA